MSPSNSNYLSTPYLFMHTIPKFREFLLNVLALMLYIYIYATLVMYNFLACSMYKFKLITKHLNHDVNYVLH